MGLFEQDSRLSTRAGSTVVLMGACCLAIFVQSESVNLEGTTPWQAGLDVHISLNPQEFNKPTFLN
jgi:hypothetical protein